MPFQKTSLRQKERKKKFKKGFKRALIALGFVGSMALLLPKTIIGVGHKKQKRSKIRIFFGIIFILIASITLFLLTDYGQETGKNIATEIIKELGKPLPKDDDGQTNILILGMGGGEKHAGKGHNLADSIMIASINEASKTVVMLSIPRDFYIKSEETRINSVIRDVVNRIVKEKRNEPDKLEKRLLMTEEERKKDDWAMEAEATVEAKEILRKELEEVFDIEIHKTASIDFAGFMELIDALEGIDVLVEEGIYDPCYPNFDWGYDSFLITAGMQHLDGITALKFVRSRHNFYNASGKNNASCAWASENLWDNSSDFDRAARQQKAIYAIKEKAMQKEILLSPSKLKELYNVIDDNFDSDITWQEMISLAEIANDISRENIVRFVLNDDPSTTGGFLVTPNRDLYGGAFVLVPYLNEQGDNRYAQLQTFVQIIFVYRQFAGIYSPIIEIKNSTLVPGLASTYQEHLERYGLPIKDIASNEETYEKTTLRYTDNLQNKILAKIIKNLLVISDEEVLPLLPEREEIFEIIIGADYKEPLRIPDHNF